jgi:uncharacterized protein (DUF2141 family)
MRQVTRRLPRALAILCLPIVAGVCACIALRSKPASSATAPTAPATTSTSGAMLTITIKDLRNHKGDLIFSVFNQPDGFPNIQSKSIYWEVKPASADTVTFTTRLPPGRYAAGVLHDEDQNGDMDTGLAGIPLEGYGVTNNPKPKFRKATFQEATFTLPPEGAELMISVQYF